MIKHGMSHAFLALSAAIVGDQITQGAKIFLTESVSVLLGQYPQLYHTFNSWINNYPYSHISLILIVGFLWGVVFKNVDS